MYFMRAFPLRLEPELWPFSFQLTVNIAALAYRALENPGTRSLNAADSSALTVAEIGAFLFTTLQRAAALCPRVSPSIVFGPIAIGPVFLKRDAASFCAKVSPALSLAKPFPTMLTIKHRSLTGEQFHIT
jgi:hypothetical protein